MLVAVMTGSFIIELSFLQSLAESATRWVGLVIIFGFLTLVISHLSRSETDFSI